MILSEQQLLNLSQQEMQNYIALALAEIKLCLHANVLLCEEKMTYVNEHMSRFNFIGFMEIPDLAKHSVIERNCLFSVAFKTSDNRYFIPVGFKRERNRYFSNDDLSKGSYIVVLLGNNNCAYGQRFMSQELALDFVDKGWPCGFIQDLLSVV